MTDGRFEPIILRSLLYHEELTKRLRVTTHVKPEYFEEEAERLLYTTIRKHVVTYERLPTPEAVLLALDAARNADAVTLVDDERQPFQDLFVQARSFLQEIAASRDVPIEPVWYETELERFVKDGAWRSALLAGIHATTDPDPKKPLSRIDIAESILHAGNISLEPPSAGLTFSDADILRVHEEFNDLQMKIPTGLPSLDRLTEGGLGATELGVGMMASGKGKTHLGVHLACEAVRRNHSVLYLNYESVARQIQARIAANLTGIPNSKLRRREGITLGERQAAYRPLQRYRVAVRDMMQCPKPSDIRRVLEEYRMLHDCYPELVVVDYLQRIQPERDSYGKENSNSVLKRIVNDLLQIAGKTNTCIWTFMQVNRPGLKKATSGSPYDETDVADGICVLYDTTLWLILQHIESKTDDKDTVHISARLGKYRYSTDLADCIWRLDYEHSRFMELSPDQAEAFLVNAGMSKAEEAMTQFAKAKKAKRELKKFNV